MNLTLIRYFMAVAETGSFTRGAERANVTQPTLSAGIKRLEESLGASLFERGRAAQLTPAGARFLPRARLLLQEWTAARRELRQQGKSTRQRLRLGYVSGLPQARLAALLGSFAAAHPDTALETLEAPAATLNRRLDLGRIDAAILPLSDDADDMALSLFRQRYLLAVPTQHPLAHRSTARIVDLQDQPFVIRPQAEIMPAAERLFAALNVRPRIVGRAESDQGLLALVGAGIGIAILPHWLADGSVATLALPELRDSHRIGLVWRKSGEAASQPFRDFAAGHGWDGAARHPVIGH
ncbi:MAG: LysR family transcriptional regulator [Ferrovibrio sp.]|jgi:DNA-binding transcriptional LysR family regulator|uniref:LysR family transcriptional regulator n=1 Tax=Ferrovibrio sp. TaxID=1917215 RepID=UPI003918A52E